MHWFAWWPTLIVVAVAAFMDLRSRRIPNWLVLPFLLARLLAWAGAELCRSGAGPAGLWISFLAGRHGSRGCEAMRGDRGLDWPVSIIHGHDHHRDNRRRHGAVLGCRGWIFQRIVHRHGRFALWLEAARNGEGSGSGPGQSPEAKNALCAGHRHRNTDFFLRSLRIVGIRSRFHVQPAVDLSIFS